MANCIRCGRQLPGLTFGKKICQWCVQHEAAQRGEVPDDAPQTVMPTPWVRREASIGLTQIIFGINAAVFLGMALSSSTVMDFPVRELVHWGANVGVLTFSGEWWRLLTNVFVHGGIMHIAFNMWCLWNLGALCESLYGRWTYAGIYLVCGVGASLASAAWHPLGPPSVGASGAIFGLAGALIAAFKLGEFSVPRSALSGTLRSLGAFVVYNLIFGAVIPGIDNVAHIGGLITGLIVGTLIALIAPQQDQAPRRLAVFLVLILALLGGAIGTAHHYGFPLRLGRVNFERSANFPESTPSQIVATESNKQGGKAEA